MTAPTSGRDDATLRGAVVLVVAIVIGLALLARSGGGGDDDAASDTPETTATTEFEGTTASTTVPINDSSTTTPEGEVEGAREPSEVTVVVLNSTRTEGIAATRNDTLVQAGYNALEPGNASTGELETTTIYATTEAQADAEAVRELLAMPDAVIAEKPTEPLGPGSDEADVVVVLGLDAAG